MSAVPPVDRTKKMLAEVAEQLRAAIKEPEKVFKFNEIWNKLEACPIVAGKIQVSDDLLDIQTMNKIGSW